jgi:hypothetical protein
MRRKLADAVKDQMLLISRLASYGHVREVHECVSQLLTS